VRSIEKLDDEIRDLERRAAGHGRYGRLGDRDQAEAADKLAFVRSQREAAVEQYEALVRRSEGGCEDG